MREKRLLERIRFLSKNPEIRAGNDTGKLVDSVIAHLGKVFTTREGSVLTDLNYGIPDFAGLLRNYPDSNQEITRTLKEKIAMYEPRLGSVKVKISFVDDNRLSLHFKIETHVVSDEGNIPLTLQSIVGVDGTVLMKG